MIEKKTLLHEKKNAALKIIQTFIVEFKVSPGHVDEWNWEGIFYL